MSEWKGVTRENLQRLYDEWSAQNPEMPRELPKIEIDGTEYYVDGRLHELRNAELEPGDLLGPIRFDDLPSEALPEDCDMPDEFEEHFEEESEE